MTQQPRPPELADLISDFQRWLFRSGARGVSRNVSGQIRSALGRSQGSGDVWERATTLPQDEAPECAWCPVCRAARRLGESGPGLSSQMAAATDAFATVAQDAMSVFEAALSAARPVVKEAAGSPPADRAAGDAGSPAADRAAGGSASPGGRVSDDAGASTASPASGRGVWDEATSSPAPEGPPREPDDRG